MSATTSQLVKIKPSHVLRADNLIVISKAMAERTFKKLEDYFLNDDWLFHQFRFIISLI
jgi:hypothetical protein